VTARLLDGKGLAARIRQDIAADAVAFQTQTGVTPHMAAVLVGDNAASAVYVRNKQRACEQAGLRSTLHQLPQDATQAELLGLVEGLNHHPEVHGILVQLPLPPQIDEAAILDAVHPLKDVDCFHPENVGLLAQGRPRFAPCTPAGCQRLITECGAPIEGAHVVILGRSEIVGKPLALLLMQKGPAANATVTVCHSRTRNIAAVARQADILIAAIGRPGFVTVDMVQPGAVVIDVGINRLPDGRLVGDVDFNAVRETAGALTPVPGGVGPMTIAMLLGNTLQAARLQRSPAAARAPADRGAAAHHPPG
jgi:methylenetetrahydrofolate dehydrogenase (NADP+)/methenyltetrahydrofolate cyclohydrolase